MQHFELRKFTKTSLPLAVWLETPRLLYQEPHTHNCCEIVFICSGTGWSSVNGVRSPILGGDVYIFGPSDIHEFSCNPGLKFYNLMFSSEIFLPEEKELFSPLLAGDSRYTIPPVYRERLTLLLSELTSELKEGLYGVQVAARAHFICFMAGLLRYCSASPDIGEKSDRQKMISRMFDLISRRYREKLTLDDLAAVTGGSSEYAGRLFKKLTGMTFTAYLNRYRIDMACVELEKDQNTISEIAVDLGYFDTAYFDKCFKRIIGMSPISYRRRFLNGGHRNLCQK